MLTAICMIVLTLMAFVIAMRARLKNEGFYSTGLLFALGGFFYFLSIPIEHFIRGTTTGVIENYFISIPVTPEFYIRVFAMGFVGILAFTLGLTFSGFKSAAPDVPGVDTGFGARRFETALWLMWAGLIAILFVFFRDFLHTVVKSYEDSYGEQYTNPLPTLICQLIELLNSILAVYLVLRKKILPCLIALVLFSVNFFMTYLFKEKAAAVITLIGVGYLYFFFIRDRRFALAGMVVGICLALFVLKPLYDITSIYGYPRGELWERLSQKKPTLLNLDSAGPMALIAYELNQDEPPTFGKELVQSFNIFVPRFVWKDRPIDVSEAIAKKLIPNWQPGIGMGYSPLIEGYANFGFWLSFLEFLVFGLLWGLFWRGFMKIMAFYNAPRHLDVIYRVVGFYILILFFRGMIAGGVKFAILIMLPFSIALLGMQCLSWLNIFYQKKRHV